MAAVASGEEEVPPGKTVYVKNLEERIKIPDLIKGLREVFDTFGNVVDIVAKTNLKAKGQAFVVYDSVQSAQDAIDNVNDFPLFDKPMKLAFAKSKSDSTVKLEGNEQDFETHKRHRLAEKERKQALEAEANRGKKRPTATTEQEQPQRPIKRTGLKSTGAGGGVVPDEYLPPNKILFIRQIPDDYSIDALTAIFSRFGGFKEVRAVPGRKGIAFVEYMAVDGAISAKEATAGMKLGESEIKVTFQRQ